MFCKECGTQLPDGTKFCTSCGTSLVMESKINLTLEPEKAKSVEESVNDVVNKDFSPIFNNPAPKAPVQTESAPYEVNQQPSVATAPASNMKSIFRIVFIVFGSLAFIFSMYYLVTTFIFFASATSIGLVYGGGIGLLSVLYSLFRLVVTAGCLFISVMYIVFALCYDRDKSKIYLYGIASCGIVALLADCLTAIVGSIVGATASSSVGIAFESEWIGVLIILISTIVVEGTLIGLLSAENIIVGNLIDVKNIISDAITSVFAVVSEMKDAVNLLKKKS